MTANRPDDPDRPRHVIQPEDDDAHVAEVEQLLRRSGLRTAIVLLRANFAGGPEVVEVMRRGIEIARRFGASYVMTGSGGATRPEHYERFYATAAAVLADLGNANIGWLIKPHGGLTATAADCLAAVRQVGSPRFGVCWDPANVWHYTNTPPDEGFAGVAPYVRAVCLKDYAQPGQERPVRPGLGGVDWRYHFTVLRDHGFSGPCLIETLPGETVAAINAAAVDTRRYFEDLFASLAT